MDTIYFTNFGEAAHDLLEVVNSALPGKTLFLSKKLKDAFSIEKVLDNHTGVKILEGDIVLPENTY
ncbi:hypothetical protein V7128_07705 [Neobacillus vireti]|uniref:hypothetical protein n=1 Tax=Neobacillus vireti TaxID=220686 RepID=UPI00300036A2